MYDSDIVTFEVLQKANRPNNSGYLSNQYQEPNVFPSIEEHHFRIEDDKTILELQKLYAQSKPQQINYKQDNNSEFSMKMNSLIQLLDSRAPFKAHEETLKLGNTFYSLEDTQFDPDLAYKEMIERLNVDMVREGISKMSIEDKPTKVIKFKKREDSLVTKMNKLDIQEY